MSVTATERDVESCVSCDHGPMEIVAYDGECGAYSCVSMEPID